MHARTRGKGRAGTQVRKSANVRARIRAQLYAYVHECGHVDASRMGGEKGVVYAVSKDHSRRAKLSRATFYPDDDSHSSYFALKTICRDDRVIRV